MQIFNKMRLIWLLIFCLFNFPLSYTFDFIENDKKKTITDNYGYIDLLEFNGYFNLQIITTVKNGSFDGDKYLYITGGSERPVKSSVYNFDISYYYKKEIHEMKDGKYKYQTLNYYIPKNSDWRYCYFEFPKHSDGSLEVTITTSGVPIIIVWVVPVTLVFIIIGIIILVRYCKSRKSIIYNRQLPAQPESINDVSNTFAEPIFSPESVY